ncbi:MAG: HAD family hydrolase [Candidatus Binatia bacterium]
MKTYRAVLFDLFGTVALFDWERLPLFVWNGQTSRSTMGGLRPVIEQKVPTVPFDRFFTALSEVSAELAEARARELREFSSPHRFTLALTRAGLGDCAATHGLAEELSLAHMGFLSAVTTVPPAHLALLAQVCKQYKVALVSNFDHAPTARRILQQSGSARYFHHVAISDEHTWRKPHPKIFTDALAALEVEPEEALFVGDSPGDDIAGAKGVGMDVAWVNAQGAHLPASVPPPEHIVQAIPQLHPILFP